MEAEKRDRILSCAAGFFERFGFRKTSVAEIARDAGVAKGTVYLAAESKADLYFQVLHREVLGGVAHGRKFIDPRRPAPELLPRVLGADLEYFDNKPLIRQLLIGQAADSVHAEREQFHELKRVARSNFVEVIQLGQRQGEFREEVDADMAATLIQDIEVATIIFLGDQPGYESLDHPRWQTTLDIFTRGLSC